MATELETHVTQAVTAGQKAIALDAAVIARLTQLASDFAVNLTIAAIILAATIFISRWASATTRRILGRVRGFRHDPTVLSFAVQVVRVVVLLVGLIAVLQRLGVQTTSIIAVLGAASLAVGLALQGTLSNVAAGVMLLILRPYRVGDLIKVGADIGTVQRLDLFTTQLMDGNNTKIVVPNKKVIDDTILNLSGQRTRRMEIKIGVGYGANLNEARDVLLSAARSVPEVMKEPAPWCGVTNLLDSSVELTLHAWTQSGDHWQGRADVFQAAKEALDAAGIDIPYPHQVAIQSDASEAAGDGRPGPKPASSRDTSSPSASGAGSEG